MMGVPGAFGLKGERGPSGPKGNTGPPGAVLFFFSHCDKNALLICDHIFFLNMYFFFVPQASVGSQVTKALYLCL